MITIPNILSLLRLPLALCFLGSHTFLRAFALLGAMATDGLDGFIARRFKMGSKLGVFLDPLMDKFFVFFVISIFVVEDRMSIPAVFTLMSRDIAVALFGFYLFTTGRMWNYRFKSFWCGKASTALQFIVLLLINFGVVIPIWLYASFIGLGGLALIELYLPTATPTN